MNRRVSRGTVHLETRMNTTMTAMIIGLLLVLVSVQPSFAQDTAVEQEIAELSAAKWQVTEVYQRVGNGWKLLAMTFSSVRDTHTLEH